MDLITANEYVANFISANGDAPTKEAWRFLAEKIQEYKKLNPSLTHFIKCLEESVELIEKGTEDDLVESFAMIRGVIGLLMQVKLKTEQKDIHE